MGFLKQDNTCKTTLDWLGTVSINLRGMRAEFAEQAHGRHPIDFVFVSVFVVVSVIVSVFVLVVRFHYFVSFPLSRSCSLPFSLFRFISMFVVVIVFVSVSFRFVSHSFSLPCSFSLFVFVFRFDVSRRFSFEGRCEENLKEQLKNNLRTIEEHLKDI